MLLLCTVQIVEQSPRGFVAAGTDEEMVSFFLSHFTVKNYNTRAHFSVKYMLI